MAEEDDTERTEEPTQKKLDEARRRGDVPKSQEVNNWFLLAASALALAMFAPGAAASFSSRFGVLLANAGTLAVGGPALRALMLQICLVVAGAAALPLAILAVAAVLGNLVQHGLVWSLDPITPKLSKVSPLAGFKRLFSKESLLNFVKGIVKLVVVGGAVVGTVWPARLELAGLAAAPPGVMAGYLFDLIVRVFGTAVAVLAALAAADFLLQRQSWLKRQRMSVPELREEFKQSEGDPQIKARIRRLRAERSRRRMMAKVPEATVVIANPTHFAVALKYEAGMNAPLCLAKGVDALALRIRALAEEHRIAVVENPPLARALYAAVEIDAEIPPEHYRAVAEVIGYVMGLKRRRAASRPAGAGD
jgi:flagellar biosynthetic protein FlhB